MIHAELVVEPGGTQATCTGTLDGASGTQVTGTGTPADSSGTVTGTLAEGGTQDIDTGTLAGASGTQSQTLERQQLTVGRSLVHWLKVERKRQTLERSCDQWNAHWNTS